MEGRVSMLWLRRVLVKLWMEGGLVDLDVAEWTVKQVDEELELFNFLL